MFLSRYPCATSKSSSVLLYLILLCQNPVTVSGKSGACPVASAYWCSNEVYAVLGSLDGAAEGTSASAAAAASTSASASASTSASASASTSASASAFASASTGGTVTQKSICRCIVLFHKVLLFVNCTRPSPGWFQKNPYPRLET